MSYHEVFPVLALLITLATAYYLLRLYGTAE